MSSQPSELSGHGFKGMHSEKEHCCRHLCLTKCCKAHCSCRQSHLEASLRYDVHPVAYEEIIDSVDRSSQRVLDGLDRSVNNPL